MAKKASDAIRIRNDKRNINTKTPIKCKKCISHPDLMIKKAFSGNKKYIIFPYFSCTCTPQLCAYMDATLLKVSRKFHLVRFTINSHYFLL